MGKTLADLLGLSKGNSKQISKLKTLLSLAVCRITILKNHHQARSKLARGDVAQLLQLGHYDRALLRAELVVKEENLLDVFAMIQSHCHLVCERIMLLLQRQKECPSELKEAVSSLIYASSRSGEMPELMHVCKLFSSMFGKEFSAAATELRNCCGVNTKIVQKLSTKQPSLESRMRIVKEIAAEEGIALDPSFEEDPFDTSYSTRKERSNSAKNKTQVHSVVDAAQPTTNRVNQMHNYKDVASAAQAACEKAEDAAAAARAAMELSRQSHSSNDINDHDNRRNNAGNDGINQSDVNKNENDIYSSESEDENNYVNDDGEIKNWLFVKEAEKISSEHTSDSSETAMKEQQVKLKDMRYGKKKALGMFKLSFNSSMDTETESDRAGLLDSANECYNTNSECETVATDCTQKSPEKQQKVTRRAVSVRTKRGMFK